MVRILTFGMCVLLLLPGRVAASPGSPVPRLKLKRELARTDAQGIRCTVGSAITNMEGSLKTESFVEVAGIGTRMGALPEGLYLGAMVFTTRGPRLVINRNLAPAELATTYAEAEQLTTAQIDDLILKAIAAPLIVDRPVKTTRLPQIGIGKLDAEACEVHNDNDNSRSHVGLFLKLVISIEGEVPAPQPERVAPQPTAPQPAAVEKVDPRERVVNIRNAKAQTLGAGVVVGKTMSRLYILTAQHVVWSGERKAENVTVSFFSLAGESFPVTVLDFSDDALDLAVLSIPTTTAGLPEFANLVVGNPHELVLGATVRSVGHPGGVLWKMAATPEKFSRRASSDLEFESLIADSGSSGGGLFNGCGALIGITKKAGASVGVATPIDRDLDKLAEWNIQITSTTLACDSK